MLQPNHDKIQNGTAYHCFITNKCMRVLEVKTGTTRTLGSVLTNQKIF